MDIYGNKHVNMILSHCVFLHDERMNPIDFGG